jgi:hypothetical protein
MPTTCPNCGMDNVSGRIFCKYCRRSLLTTLPGISDFIQLISARRHVAAMIGMTVAPFVLLAIYSALAGDHVFFAFPTDTLIFFLSMIIGVGSLIFLPIEAWRRIVVGIFYVPFLLIALFIMTIYLACAFYPRCL